MSWPSRSGTLFSILIVSRQGKVSRSISGLLSSFKWIPLGHCLSFARCLARQPVCFEALVVFLKFWFGLAVRYRLPRCRRMERPSLSLLRELIQSRFFLFSHRFALTPGLNQARRIVCC